MNRFVGLVMRFYNSIVLIFETSINAHRNGAVRRKTRAAPQDHPGGWQLSRDGSGSDRTLHRAFILEARLGVRISSSL